jgi:hypothetical protein
VDNTSSAHAMCIDEIVVTRFAQSSPANGAKSLQEKIVNGKLGIGIPANDVNTAPPLTTTLRGREGGVGGHFFVMTLIGTLSATTSIRPAVGSVARILEKGETE